MFDTHLNFTPNRVQTWWRERERERHRIGLFEILSYQFNLKINLKTREGEPFKLLLDLYFSSVGNSRCRTEP